ncbi:hypothetical protein GGX14DRAFT_385399 [Mycena pura]|uniref:Uncharacterized protein n=1 Tax=Mycena pura TaxID=153505 RepID=A0AAD6YTR6_9AGAR|nr:hypothetical protein GGX14DRAFT_385399 [Mycena pura]
MTTAFEATEEDLGHAEDDVSAHSNASTTDFDEKTYDAFNARADDARGYANARVVVDRLLSHHLFDVSQTALLSPSFGEIAQLLENAAATPRMSLDFRREWRRFHDLPDQPHNNPPTVVDCLSNPIFGDAVALLVDIHVSDIVLSSFVVLWRCQNEAVSERVCVQLLKQCVAWSFVNKSFCYYLSDDYGHWEQDREWHRRSSVRAPPARTRMPLRWWTDAVFCMDSICCNFTTT